ncbi:MAG: hypothetical protein JXR84_04030 [Anaerolineae bacterium]|nr:hypothetical protein [Anaerolineae bacterium]
MDLLFNGLIIRANGLDGPYNLSRVELRVVDDNSLVDAVDNVHTTSAYQYTDFDPFSAAFTENFNDTGIDINSDGLYDLLRVNVSLDVHKSGTYTITGELEGSEAIAVASKTVTLTTGSQNVYLDFDGQLIFHRRENGPYKLKALRVEDANRNRIDFVYNAYITNSYSYDEFQHSGTTINASSYTDQGIDTDGNGDYDYLRVEFQIAVDQPGIYRHLATLKDNEWKTITSIIQDTELLAGTNNIILDFAGVSISQHRIDGPYQVTSVAFLDENGTLVDYQPAAHITQAYSFQDFAKNSNIYLPIILKW